MKEILNKIEGFLLELGIQKPAEVKLADYVSGEKTISVNDETKEAKIGEEVAADGEYPLEDGSTLIVKDGIAEVKEVEAESEVAVEAAEEVASEESAVSKKSIEEIIDMSKDGYYTIEVSVANGEISWGSVYGSTYEDLQLAEVTKVDTKLSELKEGYEARLEAQKVEFETKLSELGKLTGSTKVVQAPVATEAVMLSKKDLIKARILN